MHNLGEMHGFFPILIGFFPVLVSSFRLEIFVENPQ